MAMRALTLAALTILALGSADPAVDRITAAGIRGHLYYLSHDLLEGRGTGTRGGDLAAEYIAAQYQRMGLLPVEGSYFQDVPLLGIHTDLGTASLAFGDGEASLAAELPGQAVVWSTVPGEPLDVAGDVVFVGYGIDAPEWNWDDFEGRDLTGRVLIFLLGDPPAPPDERILFEGRALTYYGRWTYKFEEAARRGAAGALLIHHPDAAGYGWDVVTSSWAREHLQLDRPEGPPAVPLQGWLTEEMARAVLAMAGLELDELVVQAARRDFRPVATGLTLDARADTRSRRVSARNVVGRVPGRHVSRRDQVVIFTAHYDHLGIGPADAHGDSIYNGTYDNAGGVSVFLEVAGALAAEAARPDRTVVFLATTGEEAGLLGSTHYVRQPLFPLASTVAAINVDGVSLWGETEDMIVIGAERSDLGRVVTARARALDIDVRPDPAPGYGAFFRSDHFPFARAGIPATSITHGHRFRGRSEEWALRTLARVRTERYHRPGDRYDPAFDLDGAVQHAVLVLGLLRDLANADARPDWLPGGRPHIPGPLTNPSADPGT
jgi:Zn-dependent M28 family amino/carboxypeptidase